MRTIKSSYLLSIARLWRRSATSRQITSTMRPGHARAGARLEGAAEMDDVPRRGPDVRITIEVMVAEGDKVAVRWLAEAPTWGLRAKGTIGHRGRLTLLPSAVGGGCGVRSFLTAQARPCGATSVTSIRRPRRTRGVTLADDLPPADLAAARSGRDALAAQDPGHLHVGDSKPELQRLALDAPVPPTRILSGEPQNHRPPLRIAARRLPGRALGKAAHLRWTRSRCQRSKVSRLGSRADQPDLGNSLLRAASTRRSPGCQVGLPTLRSSTRS